MCNKLSNFKIILQCKRVWVSKEPTPNPFLPRPKTARAPVRPKSPTLQKNREQLFVDRHRVRPCVYPHNQLLPESLLKDRVERKRPFTQASSKPWLSTREKYLNEKYGSYLVNESGS